MRESPPPDLGRFAHDHGADIIFWSLCIVFGTWMILAYRNSFYLWMDDWTLLGTRIQLLQDNGYLDFFLRRHNEHLMAGMVLWDVALGKLFGLRSYLPWVVTVVVANIGVSWIIRAYMLRLGTTRIVAAACAPFVLIWASYGTVAYWAPESIFAITTGLVIGQFLLVEHEGPTGRRDALGAAAGMTAVLIHSSAAMFGVVIVAILLWRRRFRAATVASIPVVVAGLWYVTYGRGPQVWKFSAFADSGPGIELRRDPETMVRFMGSMTSKTLMNGTSILVTCVILLVVAYGAIVALRKGQGRLISFSLGSTLLFMGVVAWTRAHFSAAMGMEPAGRYAAVVGLLLLPIVVLACQDLASRWLPNRPWVHAAAGMAVFVLVLGLQVRSRDVNNREILLIGQGTQGQILQLADSADLEQMDGDQRVFETTFMDLTVEDVRRLVRMGWFDEG